MLIDLQLAKFVIPCLHYGDFLRNLIVIGKFCSIIYVSSYKPSETLNIRVFEHFLRPKISYSRNFKGPQKIFYGSYGTMIGMQK